MSLDFLGASEVAPSLEDVRAGRAVLKKGMKGEAVTYAQALAGAIADGDFGPATEAAVKKFQGANGLTADGIVGVQTLVALDKLAGGGTAGVENVDFSAPTPAPAIATSAAPVKTTTPATRPASVPAAELLAAKSQPTPVTTYAAYGLGGVAVLGLGFALFKGKKR